MIQPALKENGKTQFPHLLSPLTIGTKQVRNRILVSAHVPGFAENNKPGEQYIAYHRNYAKNGVGLQITGGTPIHTSGLLGTTSDALWNLDDSIIPGYLALSEAVHEEGGCILAQLAHSAGTVLINQPGRESWSASAYRSEITGNISHAMSLDEIQQIIAAYAAGASRASTGNMDGVEILSAFGFLPQAFLSPLTNSRRDNYGGSLENRIRFLIELLETVRSAIGPARILGVRIPGDEFEPGGLGIDDMKPVAALLANSGLVDYLSITAHTNIGFTGRALHWAPTPARHGIFVHLAAAIRSVVNIPVFTVGRITDPGHAESIIADQQADMVGMTRAHICDPEIVKKIKSGSVKQIRPCVGANTCIANRYIGKPINCMHNASIATPGTALIRTSHPQTIAVIGAGPAGLEVARIAAERGHRVTIYERSNKIGGQLVLWAASPSMGELGNIIRWRKSELKRLHVDIQLNQRIDQQGLNAIKAEVLIIATGSNDICQDIEGDHNIETVTPHALLRGLAVNARKAIVINEGRGQAGLAAAELLLKKSVEVEIITSDIAVAADLDPTNRTAWYSRLGESGCIFTSTLIATGAESSSVNLKSVYDSRTTSRDNIDLIVNWTGCQSNRKLIDSTKPAGINLFSIGDCVTPRSVEIAISEATLLANAI